MEINNMEVPKVFISYSHDDEEHKVWVKKLASDMRSHGIDVILDQWDLEIGKDLRLFMEDGLSESKYVVCICSEKYVKKADQGYGGVGYETTIISSDLLRNVKTDYILPIIRNNSTDKKIPIFLSNKLYIDFDEDNYYSNYCALIKTIHKANTQDKPPVGINPFHSGSIPSISREVDLKTEVERIKFNSVESRGIAEFNYSDNNSTFTIGSGSAIFSTKWTGASNKSIYAYSDLVDKIGYNQEQRDFPKLVELDQFNYTSRVRKISVGEIVIFKNKFGRFAAVKILEIKAKSHGSDEDLLKFEYKIYDAL